MRRLIVGTLIALAACGDNGGSGDDPVIAGASLTTDEDAPITHNVEASDPAGLALALTSQVPAHGTVAIDRLRVTYTPAPNYNGADSFTVTASNGKTQVSAQIDVTVRPVNDAPAAAADTFAVDEDTALARPISALLANDTDVDGDALSVASVQGATNGTVARTATDVTFTPAANFTGMASFQYTITDGKATSTTTVTVTVGGVNDPPVAGDDTVTTAEDTPVAIAAATLLANDTDPEGQTLTVTAVGNATSGTVAITGGVATFTPAANFNGTATFDYTVSDGAATDTGTVTVTVTPVNDAPVAVDDSSTTPEDTALQLPATGLVANDTDAEGQTLSVTAVGNATRGTVALAGGIATFIPAANFNGIATFDYTVSDGTASDTGTVTINVTAVNDAPAAGDDTATTAEDVPLVLTAATLLANDTDVDGPSLSITQVGGATNGSVALAGGNVTFQPAANFNGTAGFTYTVSDGTAIATGTVTVTVTPVNDAPVGIADTATGPEDVQVVISAATLLANDTDVDGDTLTITQVGGATNGSVALAGGTVTFRPATNFNGTASFTYTLTDGTLTATGAVTITLTPVNDAPVAGDDTGSVQAGNDLVLSIATLLGNDTDVDGQALSITAVQGAVNGTAVLGATTITFTADAGFVGDATFDYVVSDGTATDIGTVTISVQPGPVCGDGTIASPETCDDGNIAAGDGCSAACVVEGGWNCSGAPSTCTSICGDGIRVGPEQCDDANGDETDGCTTQCVTGALCNATARPGGDRFAVDPATGHCYAAFDDDMTAFAAAQGACAASGGYLVTITSAGEQGLAHSVQNPAQNPWIGAGEDANTDDAIFDWVTDEPFGFTAFAPGQPDNDNGFGGLGDCLHMLAPAGQWNDTNCTLTTFVVGRICEIEPQPCGDSVRQPTEECDDGNTTGGDGCSATCLVEDGCGDGNLDAGEECDDDNITGGDGCSATCQFELSSVTVTPTPISIDQQERVRLKAVATYFGGAKVDVTATAAWMSSDPSVATVGTGGINNGRVESLAVAGSATVTAAFGGLTGTAAVNVGAATCHIRINEIQVAGDGTNNNSDEFTEIVNPCTFTVNVAGWTLVYRSFAGTTDTAPVSLTGTMAPGAFRFYVGAGYNGGGTPDGVISGSLTGTYAAAGGGVALRSGPATTGAIVDSVGWGTATNAFVEGTPVAAPPANRSVVRSPYDGKDSNVNSADFVLTDVMVTPPTVPTPGSTNFP